MLHRLVTGELTTRIVGAEDLFNLCEDEHIFCPGVMLGQLALIVSLKGRHVEYPPTPESIGSGHVATILPRTRVYTDVYLQHELHQSVPVLNPKAFYVFSTQLSNTNCKEYKRADVDKAAALLPSVTMSTEIHQ